MEICQAAQAHGYQYAYERWDCSDEIDLIDIDKLLAEEPVEEVEPAPVAVQ
jgi:hypothetical protein